MKKVIVDNTTLDDSLVEELYYCISARLGFIETGTTMRANDAIKSGQHNKIKQLSLEQKKLIVKLETLMELLL